MPVSESMVQDIVKEVVARMQLSGSAGTAQHGVFTDMNQAIEAAKEAEAKVRCMTRSSPISAERLTRTRSFLPVWVWKKPEWATWATRF